MYKTIIDHKKLEIIHEFNVTLEVSVYHSGNSLYTFVFSRGRPRNVKHEKASLMQKEISNQLEKLPKEILEKLYAYEVCAKIDLGESWFLKSKDKLKRLDLTNIWKVVEDGFGVVKSGKKVLHEGLGEGFDDSLCIRQEVEKVYSTLTEDEPYKIYLAFTLYGKK